MEMGVVAHVSLEVAKKSTIWGTYGKPATRQLRWVRLIDCSTEHLQAILETQHHITEDCHQIILAILKDRF